MARSLVKLQPIDRGFDTEIWSRCASACRRAGYADVYARDEFTQRLIDRAAKLPGVAGATSGALPPART